VALETVELAMEVERERRIEEEEEVLELPPKRSW